jgi:hypothetical protein
MALTDVNPWWLRLRSDGAVCAGRRLDRELPAWRCRENGECPDTIHCFAVHASLTAAARAALLVTLAALLPLLALPASASARIGEWRHAWEVVQLTQLSPPRGTPIFYLGDSTTRESTVRDALWTRQLRRRAVAAGKTTATVVFTLASHGQTFRMDRQLLSAMPARAAGAPPGIAVIGVGLSRFIGPPVRRRPAAVKPPGAGRAPSLHPWVQHLYTDREPLPLTRKHELVPRWMDRRWDGFRRYRRDNLRAVDRLLAVTRARGLRPVLLEMPLDVRVVEGGLDRPRGAYRVALRRLAKRHHAEYLSLNRRGALPTGDYWDLMHLLPEGSRVWQSRLSDQLVEFLPEAPPAL